MAVIKLLSKGGNRLVLKNWKPISLLPLTYKLIGKILSERLKSILPRLVDQDQMGFVEGRNIMDNVLSIKLCQDMTNITGNEINFLTLKCIIEKFKRIAGARLNLSKSIILPIMMDRRENWLHQTGCQILGQQDESTYLGCKIGEIVGHQQHTLDLAEKSHRRIAH
ncbi:hypothetical protein R1sor_018495 [Riccia sorocarpa]|uniref:Reverse transcriptase domain-containing protein n=1 Tax=Riccia sorocarpa TaxID=122646 RepID=A0ABD3I9Y4_9MARC